VSQAESILKFKQLFSQKKKKFRTFYGTDSRDPSTDQRSVPVETIIFQTLFDSSFTAVFLIDVSVTPAAEKVRDQEREK
jgi:hypothetical protein